MIENYVLERVTRVLIGHGVTSDTAGLALRIMRTIQAGDDIGNGLRAIPIKALDELREFLNRNAQTLAQGAAETNEPTLSAA